MPGYISILIIPLNAPDCLLLICEFCVNFDVGCYTLNWTAKSYIILTERAGKNKQNEIDSEVME